MRKSGGIIALIAGIFGTIAALVTLTAGGLVAGLEKASASADSTAVNGTGSTQIVGFGLAGLLFAFLTIVLGAVALNVKSRKVGIMIIGCAIVGAITGGTFVAICMALALIGGILVSLAKAEQ